MKTKLMLVFTTPNGLNAIDEAWLKNEGFEVKHDETNFFFATFTFLRLVGDKVDKEEFLHRSLGDSQKNIAYVVKYVGRNMGMGYRVWTWLHQNTPSIKIATKYLPLEVALPIALSTPEKTLGRTPNHYATCPVKCERQLKNQIEQLETFAAAYKNIIVNIG